MQVGLDDVTLAQLSDPKLGGGQPFPLLGGGLLQDWEWACGQIYLVRQGEEEEHGWGLGFGVCLGGVRERELGGRALAA